MYIKRTSNNKMKHCGVLALSLLLIAAMILPQAVAATQSGVLSQALATDSGTSTVIATAGSVSERSEARQSREDVNNTASNNDANAANSGATPVATSMETALENSGGGGQNFR